MSMALHIAPAIKLIGNSILLGMLEILAESFTLAEKSGVDAKDVQEVIKGMSLCLNSGSCLFNLLWRIPSCPTVRTFAPCS